MGRDVRFRFVENTCASASVLARGSANRRQRRIDRERLQRLVVAPQAVGEEAGDLRLVRQLGVAAEADRLRRVRRPERHASASGRAGDVVEAQRAVPDERRREVVEPRSAVGDAQHVLRVRPLGADGEVVGARVVGQRHLDVVAEAEAGAEGQLAAVLLRREAGRHVELRRRRRDDVDAADVAPLAQLELRRDRGVGAEARSALGGALRRIVEHQRAAGARVGRRRVDAVELRDLLVAPGERQLPDAVVVGEVLLIATADIVRARVEGVGAVGLRERIAEAGEEQPVADVLVALKARRVAVDAAHAAADEELPVGQREQAGPGLGIGRRGGRLRRGRLCRRGRRGRLRRRLGRRRRRLRACGRGHAKCDQEDQSREDGAAHQRSPVTACRTGPTGDSSRGRSSGSSRTIGRTSGCSCWW